MNSARLHEEAYVTQLEVSVGKLLVLSGKQLCKIFARHHIVMQKRLSDITITVPDTSIDYPPVRCARDEFES